MVRLKKVKNELRQIPLFILCCGIALLLAGLGQAENAYAFDSAIWAIQELCGHMKGNYGALLMSTAGVGAIVSAAFGNYKASYGFIITGIGAFTITSMLSLYFPDAAQYCQ